MEERVIEWCNEIKLLGKAALQEPQLSYIAFVQGLSKKWNFLMRTTPNISGLLMPVEEHIQQYFIQPCLGRNADETYRNVYFLPTRYGGLNINDPTRCADTEYQNSKAATSLLVNCILEGTLTNPDSISPKEIKAQISHENNAKFKTMKDEVLTGLSEEKARYIELASEKGASAWLQCLPLENCGFQLNKQEFHDAVSLRYGHPISGIAKVCACGTENSVNHSLICKKGGFVSMRHNSLRDTIASALTSVCKDVKTEPKLIPLTEEQLQRSANTADDARLDISARNFWFPMGRSFFDIRVLHPGSTSNAGNLCQMYERHEKEKKRLYNERVIQIEKGTFTPLVFSTSGGMSNETGKFLKRLALLLSSKTGQDYSHCITFLRKRLRFDLLRTCVISLRGYRGASVSTHLEDIDMNLI